MSHDAPRALRRRVAAAMVSEPVVWALVLAFVSGLAAASGALSD
ncbi:hypothetical protein [Cellulomonas endophytica]|nr:hypothetical protein [Cellulomonas endophytica]